MKKLVLAFCILISFNIYSQEKRLALVIGNSAYVHGGVLKNPVNDAYAMKLALSQVGFEVIVYYNLDQSDMKMAIDDFGQKLRNYDVGLFFYAGHGLQAKGNNYLVPVDANLLSENDVEYNCINAGRILGKMEDAGNNTNIIILDACRNNPFERSWTRSTNGTGLASMDAPIGSILAFATAPGRTASDGTGLNGLYTSSLIESIIQPGLSIENVFKQVRVRVINESNGNQIPWESTSLTGDFYFHDGKELKDNILTDVSSNKKEVLQNEKKINEDAHSDFLSEKLEPFDKNNIIKNNQLRGPGNYEVFGVMTCSRINYNGNGSLNPKKAFVNIKQNISREESFYIVTKFQNGPSNDNEFQGVMLQLKNINGDILSSHISYHVGKSYTWAWAPVTSSTLLPGIYTIHAFLFKSPKDAMPEGKYHKIERIRIL